MARALAWFWSGLAFGVSFIATPVKFRAASLDMSAALEVGHVTFHALNRIEWLLAAALAFALARTRRLHGVPRRAWNLFALLAILIAAESAWLLPALDLRTAEVIAGRPVPPSPLHGLFVGAEAAKVLLLLALGAGIHPRPHRRSNDAG